MGINVTCDMCKNTIDGDFVRMDSDFYTMEESFTAYCAAGDTFFLCDRCYDDIIRKVQDEQHTL